MKIHHVIYHIVFAFCLTNIVACNDTDVETQIVTEIVQVPPPEPNASDINLNIDASQIDGTLMNNGGGFPANIYEDGEILFKGTSLGDEFNVGSTPFQSYDVLVINDEYDAIYQVDSPGSQIPLNQNATIIASQLVDGDATLDLDVTSVEITPVFTLNGGNFPASQYDHGFFYLQPAGSNELIFIGDSNVVNQPIRVVPGVYHVIYDYVQGTVSPINKNARVRESVLLDSDQVLNVDVSSGDFRATFSLNGDDFPVSQYDHAEFYLSDRVTGGESFIMKSYEPFVTVPVIDGSYDIIYKVTQANTIPINRAKVIVDNLTLSGGGAINHDVVSITIGANVTLNGEAFQVSEYQDGIIELYDTETDSYTELGNTHSPFADILIIPGTYDITYSHESGDAVPQNTHGVISSEQNISSDDTLQIAVVGFLVSTDITFNTAAFPSSQYQNADLVLVGSQSTDDLPVNTTANQDESIMVLPGSYDLYYRHKQGEEVPQNTNYQVLAAQSIQADISLTANIQSAYIRVAATLNQQAFPQSQYQTADIFASTGEGDEVFVLETHNSSDIIQVISGDYQFYYQHINGDSVPQNLWSLIDSQTISPPPS